MPKIVCRFLPRGVKKCLVELTFTELAIISIFIVIIAGIFSVSFKPVEHFAKTRNAERWRDVNLILNSIVNYQVDRDGKLPAGIDEKARVLGSAAGGCDDCGFSESACLDISRDLVNDYLDLIDYDPRTGSPDETRYAVKKMADGRIRVWACDAENENGDRIAIEVMR